MASFTAEKIVNMLNPGEAAFSLAGLQEPQAVFLVRERSSLIKYLGNTVVEVRAAQIPVGEIIAVTVVFRVGQYVIREYATWWDYHHEQGAGIFRIMSLQEFLPFYFHGDSGRQERSFVILNPLREFFRAATEALGKLPPWDRKSFLEALMKTQSRFPTPRDLWNHAAAVK